MAKQLFGTDGIRGVAGEYPLDPGTVQATGLALGQWALRRHASPAVVIGMDTRESGPWIAAHLAEGIRAAGASVRFAGLTTTPGVAYLARTGDFVAGVMVSASHNPFLDNGIKVFDHSGFKLPDEQEHDLEQQIIALREAVEPQATTLTVDEDLDHQYLRYLASTVSTPLNGLALVVDCAHGAAAHLAPALFEKLGAHVEAIGCSPSGRNINEGVGALHVEALRKEVLARRADAGVAFDGDADRAILVSGTGKVIDGDHVLLIVARALHQAGALTSNSGDPVVVATVMSNLGLERALQSSGIRLIRTAVGDKYVLEEMVRRDAALGGEQSGHVIFRQFATTGDGMLTALRVLEIMKRSGQDLDALTSDLRVYPQLTLNVRVQVKRPLADLPSVQHEIRLVEAQLAERGRVLVRFSGTEPLARVMVEGQDQGEVNGCAERLVAVLKRELGAVPA